MESSAEDSSKPMPVITDISTRAVRERNPDDPAQDPENLEQQNGYFDESDAGTPRRRGSGGRKGRYGSYASAIRKSDAQSDLMKRKEKYAAALEGTRVDEDDLDDFYKDTGINPDEPDIMSTVPLGKIKEQYLSTAKEEGKVVPASEDRPEPHHLQPVSWPPRDESDGPRKPRVIDISEADDKPKRDGVDAGHVESVNILKERWQNLPEKYRGKPLGVKKPAVPIKADNKWITHYKPVIDEGQAPEDPEWLKMVRHRRWMSTVKARFPEDEKEKIMFEKRSTTPRKIKKPNPYTVMRSTVDIDSEFDDVMRRRRKHSDNYEEGAYLTKSQSTFVKSASSFRSDATDFTDAGRQSNLTNLPVKGPIKEYVKNLSLERVRGSMLKWAFSADVVDEPYRYDLPKPIDLLIMDEMERENEWKYEQARRKFLAEGGDGMSIQSSSHASFASEEDLHETDGPNKLFDETAGFIPKLTDIQQKLKDEVDSKHVKKTNPIEEEAKILPSIEETKDKLLDPENDPFILDTNKKKPFRYEDDEVKFEGVKDVKKRLPKPEEPPKDLFMPTTVLKEDKDFKKVMQERKAAADEAAIDRAESAAQDIKTLASDITKAFGEDIEGEKKQEKPKDLTFEDSEQTSTSNLKAFADHRRKLRPARKHAHTSNPVKARQNREDLRTETDFLVSKSQRNHVREAEELEKPVTSHVNKNRKNSKFALEAIEGLAAKVNLNEASTALRKTAKNVEGISTEMKEFGGFLPVMLLQVKGHRHLQTRLVEPVGKSLNSGDTFVLVTHKSVFVWIGKDATIMKKAKAHEVSTIVVKQRDLGTNAKTSHVIEQAREDTHISSFWKHLGGKCTVTAAKDVPSDEEYEKSIQATNVVYRVDYSRDPPELRLRDDLSGRVLSEKFMNPDHAYVLDFGPEVYLWLGRNCNKTARQQGMKLAQQIFDGKFKYKSRVNPFEPHKISDKAETHTIARPPWALLGRMTARSETVLFREKFIDWPDHNVDYTKDFVKKPVSGSFAVISKSTANAEDGQDTDDNPSDKPVKSIFSLKAVDVNLMIEPAPEPSLVLENFNIGRGTGSVDEEGRQFAVSTVDIKVWHVKEYSYKVLPAEDYGHFHSGEGYVVRWKYCVKRIGVRSLKGQASRKEDVGRDKFVYFFWQGKDSTVNEKGAAALMTVELDSDKGPQVLVAQGKEPPCFSRLFDGKMVVHLGKREPSDEDEDEDDTCMFILRNEEPEEAFLLQVKTDPYGLRSRTSFVVVDLIELILYVWHGAKSSDTTRKAVINAGMKLMKWFNEKFPEDALEYEEVEEGDEPELFWDAMRGDSSHLSLRKESRKYDYTLRVFRLNSSSGEFIAKEILNPTRSSLTTPYPVNQSQLYTAEQPAIFFIDAHYELYMWQGWWPRSEDEAEGQASTTGSAETRFNNDRRLSMETIKMYAQELKRDLSKIYIVFAGLEPKSFKALFPYWEDREDVKEINMEARKDKPVLLKLDEELTRLSRDTYSLSELQQKPLPDGVDPTRLEMYLHVAEFEKAFGMTKNEYKKTPTWKQLNLKKKAGLF